MTERGLSGSILDAIGDTPMVEIEGIYCKLEYLNPSGSIKARIAKYMIERAEDEGLLRYGDTIVEATSGNTGNALSMVAAVKGYRMLVVMPEGMSGERVAISRAFGADVMEVGHFHVNEALAKAKELGQEPGYFCPAQFESEWNVEENRIWLGPEILAQLPDGVVPGIFERHEGLVDTALAVDSEEAVEEMRRLAKQYGLFVGPSSGANLIAARRVREAYPHLRTIVTLFCDEGEKYISDHFAEKDSIRVGREAYT